MTNRQRRQKCEEAILSLGCDALQVIDNLKCMGFKIQWFYSNSNVFVVYLHQLGFETVDQVRKTSVKFDRKIVMPTVMKWRDNKGRSTADLVTSVYNYIWRTT